MNTLALQGDGSPDLPKARTGIQGLDEITGGGFPRGRPTLIAGSAGAGKTLLGLEFLVRGAREFNEPGVFVAFEETAEELAQNARSLGFDLDQLQREKKIAIDFVRIERQEIDETGDYDLEGLFVRIGHSIDQIGAKRVVLDTLEALFSGFDNEAVLRAELRRLFRWLKDKGVTAVITAERGRGMITRQGLEEYVSDCVILLDHRVKHQISTRRLRIVKYRGTTHGTNEYPFLIDEDGISVLPVTSLGLEHEGSTERVPTGIPRLDAMLGGQGYFRGSSILISGTAGTGKTSIAAQFVDAACRRGEKCVYFAFEESPAQIIRNMRSIGVDLEPHVKSGKLRLHAVRATMHGLEMHLAIMHKVVLKFKPDAVVVDPISTLIHAGEVQDASNMLTRMIDFLKLHTITAVMTNLTTNSTDLNRTAANISSMVDTWLLLRDVELAGERNKAMYLLKSRGMAHSNQMREFRLSENGIELADVYVGPEGVLTGSMRLAQEAREMADAIARAQAAQAKERDRKRRHDALEARILAMRKEFEAEESEAALITSQTQERERAIEAERTAMAASRHADPRTDKPNGGAR